MVYRKQGTVTAGAEGSAAIAKKKPCEDRLVDHYDALWDLTAPAFGQERTFLRARQLACAALVCLGRHTVSGMIQAAGHQFRDWAADYRLFEAGRVPTDAVFDVIRKQVVDAYPSTQPIIAMMDDTLVKKTGKKVDGAAWRHDPLGPHLQNNLVWAVRCLQISIALPEQESGPGRARAIPVMIQPCPTPKRPKKNATEEQQKAYAAQQKVMRLPKKGADALNQLRSRLDQDNYAQRALITAVDGGYTNREVFRRIPERTTLIGRIRKDAKLFLPPEETTGGKGRIGGERRVIKISALSSLNRSATT